MRAWTHLATSQDLVDLRLPAHDAGTGLVGRALGDCLGGGEFVYEPFDAYGAGLVANPNLLVAGSIGAGKSTLVKMVVDRGLARGRGVVVVDPKGEYGALAVSYGVTPLVLGRDGWCDPFEDETRARDLVRALLASAAGGLSDELHFALDETWRALPTRRPRRLLAALLERLAGDLRGPASARRSLALVLRRFIEGDLAGLFDGDGPALSLEGDLVVLDLSAQWSADSLAVAALSAAAAGANLARPDRPGYLVLDEAWVLLSDPASLRWLRGSWKLARSRGVSHVLVLHRFSDVGAAGDAGSATRESALGLLRECETTWLFRQGADEAREIASALSLHPHEARYLVAMPRGAALVRYGPFRSVVRVRPDARDARFIDTDSAMRA
ncbi:MAG: ATP-binding protein [Acidobacteriota bacterium]|nr:ATP-binding protein [Acidobacteriota bacterium]